jgi:type II secretory pathway pseudopilin PulG
MNEPKDRSRSFTLIELLIATLIGALTFLVLFCVSFTIQENIRVSSGILGLTETGRLAIDRISTDLRQAKAVLSSYGAYTTGDATLILDIPVANSSGTITGSDIVVYTIDSGDSTKLRQIVITTAGSPRTNLSEIVAKNIKNQGLNFYSNGTPLSAVSNKSAIKIVTVKIVTSKVLVGTERLNEAATAASMRNKKIGL